MVVAFVSANIARKAAREAHEAQLQAQEHRLRTEWKTEYMAEEAIHELLSIENWEQRRFGAIKFRIRGFSDNELRQLLVRAGAIALGGRGDAEWWGLKDKPVNRKALLEGSPEADAAPKTHSEVRPQPGSNTPDESPQDR